jgi:hypothetical protein
MNMNLILDLDSDLNFELEFERFVDVDLRTCELALMELDLHLDGKVLIGTWACSKQYLTKYWIKSFGIWDLFKNISKLYRCEVKQRIENKS